MSYIEELGIAAKAAEKSICGISQKKKNEALTLIAKKLVENTDTIINENAKDLANAVKNEISVSMQDRLMLNAERVKNIADGVMEVVALKDPIGEVIGGGDLPNGLRVVKKRVPLGVIGIIYENRPNVTVDAAVLCIKAGNVCILRGGSAAVYSNKCLVGIMREALKECGICEDVIGLVADTSRALVAEFMKMNKYMDVLIPRGGHGLISSVVKNATVPVIETGEGNCSVYVDEYADIQMAVNIVDNAKTQRPSVCNAIENVIVHKRVAEPFLKALAERWNGKVKFVGDDEAAKYLTLERAATEEDYATEFLDYTIAVKVVKSIDEAIEHINKYGTKHSECIVTINHANAEKFQQQIDAAAVYVNASTRFTDGNEFGLGAEIGISTQKLHARGPMGLEAITTYKYLVNGDGQIRG